MCGIIKYSSHDTKLNPLVCGSECFTLTMERQKKIEVMEMKCLRWIAQYTTLNREETAEFLNRRSYVH